MFNDEEFNYWLNEQNYSDETRKVIENVRNSPPSRRVSSTSKNVSGRYCSKKMGVTIQFESHLSELAAIYDLEHDDSVLEYYDQPPTIKLNYIAQSGRNIGVLHTPDFFVLRNNSAGWEECKTEEELLNLAIKMPNRYTKDESGKWICLPGLEYASQLGLYYRLRSTSEINWIYQQNLIYLEDYYLDNLVIDEEAARELHSIVNSKLGITLKELISRKQLASMDDILGLIAQDILYVNLKAELLKKTDRVLVFPNSEIARSFEIINPRERFTDTSKTVEIKSGNTFLWDDNQWTILNVNQEEVTISNDEGKIVYLKNNILIHLAKEGKIRHYTKADKSRTNKILERLKNAGLDDLAQANRRYNAIKPILEGKERPVNIPERTINLWLKKYREAEKLYGQGNGYVGLLTKITNRGNRANKIPDETKDLIQHFILNNYETLVQKRKYEAYVEFKNECEKKGLYVPSYKTFVTEINKRPVYEQTKKRQGPRAAYKHKEYMWLDRITPKHGDRPFEIGHIDHTQLDLELISSLTTENLGKAWVTFFTDAFSRRFLSVYLTFDPPSYLSCMMVIRECVRRHGRLPQILVVDGGKEFQSIYFETLLARYGVTKKTRPASKSRFGSVVERLFGTTNTRFIHTLIGNTQITRNVRQVTKINNPKSHAVWTLEALYESLSAWAYEVYDTIEHPALGQTPREAFTAGLNAHGLRSHKLIPYDDEFIMTTLPTTKKGTAKVQPGRGVKINYRYYWSDAFRNPEIENQQVPVRFEPSNIGVAYAFVAGQWTQCIAENYNFIKNHTVKEIAMISKELRKQNKNISSGLFTKTAENLAPFYESNKIKEDLLLQRKRDLELKKLYVVDNNTEKKKNLKRKGINDEKEALITFKEFN